jgi:hypothetical protein
VIIVALSVPRKLGRRTHYLIIVEFLIGLHEPWFFTLTLRVFHVKIAVSLFTVFTPFIFVIVGVGGAG